MKLSFFYSTYLKTGLLILPVFLSGVFYFFQNKQELNITSSYDKFNVYTFTDREQGGNSNVDLISLKKTIKFSYTLREGYTYPYAGITIVSKNSPHYIDLTPYDHILIRIKATKGKRVPLCLGVYIPGFTDTSSIGTYKFMERFVDLDKEYMTYKMELSEFKVPSWWYQVNKVGENTLAAPDFSKVLFLNIQNCFIINKGVEDTIEVQKILLYKDQTPFIMYAPVLISLYYIFLGILWFIRKRTGNQELVIKYEQVETVDQANTEQEKVISYISSHYTDPDLSLETIQKKTGVSEFKISSILKSVSGLSFKQYLNKLRLEEAKRLLKETNLQVSEIAYKVGYGNISHFNRVFKESEGKSPNNFRKDSSVGTE